MSQLNDIIIDGTAKFKVVKIATSNDISNLQNQIDSAETATNAEKLKTARNIDGVSFNGTADIIHYGTCSTAATTAAKTVNVTGFVLKTGASVKVKFTTTNTAANPTLNVNNTGAKPIYYRGTAISTGYLAANRTYEFVYNGNQFELVGDLNTDTNNATAQNISTANTTFPVLLGATANATSNIGDKPTYFGSGVKVNPSTSEVIATKFTGTFVGDVTGNVSGSSGSCTGNAATATRATYDENGVRISTSYAPQAQIDYLANVATNSVSAAVAAKNDAETAKDQAQQIADGLESIKDTAVDTSLAISGQAADSKTVGDKFNVIGTTQIDNDEYLCAWVDSENRVLFGVKKDGSFDWQKGLPKHIVDAISKSITDATDNTLTEEGKLAEASVTGDWLRTLGSPIENSEYLYAMLDSGGHVLFGVKKDGSFEFQKGIPKPIKEKIFTDKIETPEFVQLTQDADGKLIEGIDIEGQKVFFCKLSLKGDVQLSNKSRESLIEALKQGGFSGGAGDWSDAKELQIPKPRCAVINFTNIGDMPQAKFVDMQGVMSFWDMQGNYFRKKVIMNAQGNYTMNYPKKNIAIDICNDEWIGEDTFKLKIGDWVAQDSFHIKALWEDYTHGGIAEGGYKLVDDIWKSRGFDKDRPWKKGLIDMSAINHEVESGDDTSLQIDTGARNIPDGFPCIVYLNGDFVGIFAFQLKKHRDNFHMDKKEAKQVHLDSRVAADTILNVENINWTAFEVRNPKSLYCMDGTKYDGDTNCNELMDITSAYYNSTNKDHVRSNKVKQYINNLNTNFGAIRTAQSNYEANRTAENLAAIKAAYERVFDIENMIDYLIFCDITWNWDGVANNCQWCTYDGEKWYLCPYDLDHCYEGDASGGHINISRSYPFYYIYTYYQAECEARYAELRRLGVISVEHIIGIINDWVLSIGLDFFEQEKETWPTEPQDSLFRIKKWLDVRLARTDSLYHYIG